MILITSDGLDPKFSISNLLHDFQMPSHGIDGNSLSPSPADSPKAADMQEKVHKESSSTGSKVSSFLDTIIVLTVTVLLCLGSYLCCAVCVSKT